jgi:hypothetical protein
LNTDIYCNGSWLVIDNTLLKGIVTLHQDSPRFYCSNSTLLGAVEFLDGGAEATLENSVLHTEGEAGIASLDPAGIVHATCCDVFGFTGSWLDGDFAEVDTSNVFFLDPYFCDPGSEDYHVYEISPCLPENNGCGVLIGAYGLGCDVGEPSAENINFGDESASNIVNNVPTIFWSFEDILHPTQEQFEIAVGTDNDWAYAEMWNPPPFVTPDTSVTYAGALLEDGETYWLRLRVHNSLIWSDWTELSFRMNTVPTMPSPDSPMGDALVRTLTPDLTVANSLDAEGDSLLYTFEVSIDSFASIACSMLEAEDEGSFTTVTVTCQLEEDQRYWWRATATDYYEESEHSEAATFYVDSENTLPAAFDLVLPPDTGDGSLETTTPEFVWLASYDSDPLDSIEYTLVLSIDSLFTFVNSISEIQDTSHLYMDGLTWSSRYWWKVKAGDQNGGEIWSNQVFDFRTVTLGDADGSAWVDIDDVVFILSYIFSEGPSPQPLFAGDPNCNGEVDIDDAVYLIEYIFGGGPPPCDDFPWM